MCGQAGTSFTILKRWFKHFHYFVGKFFDFAPESFRNTYSEQCALVECHLLCH